MERPEQKYPNLNEYRYIKTRKSNIAHITVRHYSGVHINIFILKIRILISESTSLLSFQAQATSSSDFQSSYHFIGYLATSMNFRHGGSYATT